MRTTAIDKTYQLALWLDKWLRESLGMAERPAQYLKALILFLAMIIIAAIVWWVTKRIVVGTIHRAILRSKATWDDVLVKKRVFDKLAHIGPALFVNISAPYIFGDFPEVIPSVVLTTDLFIVVVVVWSISSVLTSINHIFSEIDKIKDKPWSSYTQLAKIVVYIFGGVVFFALIFGESPLTILAGMGAFAAVLILVFKDPILGFVASIQMSAYNMVRVGDWISMPKYDADGDVIEINLTTVMVQNWDRTITSIPAYAFISDSFKNWRGMTQSGGRRIKRAMLIKMSSIRFCDEAMVERFGKYQLISDYVQVRQSEIDAFNRENSVDKSELINGRHMTNVGVFRQYCLNYLRANKMLNHEMTTMVRQLDMTEKGLPIEIYCFSADKTWVNYEGIIADIFDHLLAAVPWFDLEVFEAPTGKDIQKAADRLQ